jgi:hypothetical protein
MNLSVSSTPGAISVRDTGARGDGIADDSGAIQRALDEAHRIVSSPPGVYILGDTLRIGSGKTILAHADAVLRLADGAGRDANSFLLTNSDHASGNEYIEVQGGIWDGNNEGNSRGKDGDADAYTGVALNFVNLQHLRLTNMMIRNPDSFSIRIGETRHFAVENVLFDHSVSRPNQDGVHVGGFCEDGTIRNLRALTPDTTNDDMVALNADDDVERNLNLGMKRGPIRNVHVEGLTGDSVYTFVRLLSETQRIENIRIRDISGGCRWHVINMKNWRFPSGSGDIRNVNISHVRVTKVPEASAAPLIPIFLRVRDLSIEDFERPQDDHSLAPTLVIENSAENAVQLIPVSEEDLKLTEGDSGSIECDVQAFAQPDGTWVHQAAIRMHDGAQLVLARGGIGWLALNREAVGEQELSADTQ